MKKSFLSLFSLLLITGFSFGQTLISVFPHEEDFEGNSTCSGGCTTPCNITSSWKNVGGDNMDWWADNGGTSSFQTGPTQDFNPGTSSGIYLYTESSGCINSTANLHSPLYDFTNIQSLVLEFAYHMYGTSMGTMHVDARVAGGAWTNNIVNAKTGNVNQWMKWTIPIPQLVGLDSVQFRIRGITGSSFSSDMAIDDIFVGSVFDNDLALLNVVSPVQDCNFGGSHDVKLQIRNLGILNQSSFSLAYQINDRAPVIEAFPGTINSDQTLNHTFSQQANFPGDSNYVFDSWIIFPGDENKNNDSILNLGLNTLMPFGPISFSGWGNQLVGRVVPGWREGLGNNPNYLQSRWKESDSIQSLFYSVSTARINIKGTGINDWLLTPSFVVTQPSRMFFFTALTTPNGTTAGIMGSDDKVVARISVDCGSTWTDLTTLDASSNLSEQLSQNVIVLDAYVGTEIIIGFQATSGANDPENYDFHIGIPQARFVYPNDVGISEWRLGGGTTTMNAGTGDVVYYTIKNYGSNSVPNIPVLAHIGNMLFQHIQYQSLPSNQSVEIYAGGYWAYSNGPASVPVKIYTLLAGDTIPINDTINSSITVLGVTGIPDAGLVKGLKVFPNPSKGHFQIEFDEGQFFEKLEIFGTDGTLIMERELEKGVGGIFLNLSDGFLSPGIYLLKISSPDHSEYQKLILE